MNVIELLSNQKTVTSAYLLYNQSWIAHLNSAEEGIIGLKNVLMLHNKIFATFTELLYAKLSFFYITEVT